ncbi:hypothetical protein PG990_000441 [Apiospora arundinis]
MQFPIVLVLAASLAAASVLPSQGLKVARGGQNCAEICQQYKDNDSTYSACKAACGAAGYEGEPVKE